MRACMVAYTFYETDNRVRRYAETLAKRGDHVDAFVLRRPGQEPFDVIRGVHVYRIQRRVIDETSPLSYLLKLLFFLIRSTASVTRRHLRARYDLIHVHSVPDFEVFCTLIPRVMGAKVILDIHDIVPELYASKFGISSTSIPFRLLLLMEWVSIRYSNHVIVANHLWHERLILRSARPEDCSTILNYPDPAIFRERVHHPPDSAREFLLFYPGTLSWHQGVDLLITAVARIRSAAPELRLMIVGDGPERQRLESLIAAEGLGDIVTIGGGVSMEQVAEIMARADLGVEPKRKQTFGNEALSTKIFEFMAMGVPILASDTIINRRYFGDGSVEFFISDDIDGLASAILRLMQDAPLRSQLRERGLGYIRQNNWDVKSGEYLRLVDGLKEGRSVKPPFEETGTALRGSSAETSSRSESAMPGSECSSG
jgi:glycosyltransferase involved in cell wall biosynthesis